MTEFVPGRPWPLGRDADGGQDQRVTSSERRELILDFSVQRKPASGSATRNLSAPTKRRCKLLAAASSLSLGLHPTLRTLSGSCRGRVDGRHLSIGHTAFARVPLPRLRNAVSHREPSGDLASLPPLGGTTPVDLLA